MPAVCPHCRHALPQPAPAACPHCGATLAGAAAAPRFARDSAALPARLTRSHWAWAAVAGLTVLLGLQTALADREQLAAQARWRPLVERLCGVFGCEMPAWREPAALTMLDRQVRPLPDLPGALQVQASFRNDARWAQPWPVLQLTLSDADGRALGSRAFMPREYLGVDTDPGLLAPGQSGQASFLVREPAAATAAFTFDFR